MRGLPHLFLCLAACPPAGGDFVWSGAPPQGEPATDPADDDDSPPAPFESDVPDGSCADLVAPIPIAIADLAPLLARVDATTEPQIVVFAERMIDELAPHLDWGQCPATPASEPVGPNMDLEFGLGCTTTDGSELSGRFSVEANDGVSAVQFDEFTVSWQGDGDELQGRADGTVEFERLTEGDGGRLAQRRWLGGVECG